jgi:thiamine biosynthesis lipoprotein
MFKSYLFLSACLLVIACGSSSLPPKAMRLEGPSMGTSYHIQYLDSLGRDFQVGIDSLLDDLNKHLSTYQDDSYISRFNKDEMRLVLPKGLSRHFKENLDASRVIYDKSGGLFDPTVMPLVKFWGYGKGYQLDSAATDNRLKLKLEALLKMVGLNYLKWEVVGDSFELVKLKPGLSLDFNAIAQGYGVDLVGEFLEQRGIKDYMVEIGGEVFCKGKNAKGAVWKVGINVPKEGVDNQDFAATIQLKNGGLATSGNYRKFKTVNGVKISHTINPKTGMPEINTLLSVTIVAASSKWADGYATACMVMGYEKAKVFLAANSDIKALFITSDVSSKNGYKLEKINGLEANF